MVRRRASHALVTVHRGELLVTVQCLDRQHLQRPSAGEGGDDAEEAAFATRLKEAVERVELEARVKLAEERLSDLKKMVEDLRGERDEWRDAMQRALIAHQPRRGLFAWLRRA